LLFELDNLRIGREIPFGARIIAVVEAYDAMTSDRPYRRALPQAVAIERLGAARSSTPSSSATSSTISPHVKKRSSRRRLIWNFWRNSVRSRRIN